MTDTVIVLKIYLEEPGIETQVAASLKAITLAKLTDLKIEPLAFGVFQIRAGYLIPEGKEDLAEILSQKIKEIKGVNEVEVEAMSLL